MRSSAITSNAFESTALLSGLGSSPELRALSRESDPELFFEGLLAHAARVEIAGNLSAAVPIYERIRENAGEPFSRRASQRLDAILGRGASGARVEFLMRRFAAEASDPAALLAMVTAGAVFRMTRLATLARLSANPAATVLTRGLGARTAASLAGFVLEAPAFTLTSRAANQALGRAQSFSFSELSRDLASSYLMLGGLKLGAWASGAAYRGIAGNSLASSGIMPSLFRNAGMLSGVLLGHALEQRAGLRPLQPGATVLTDSLVTLLQFQVAGRLSEGIFGNGLLQGEAAMEAQEILQRPLPPKGRSMALGPLGVPAFAMGVHSAPADVIHEPLRMEASSFPPSVKPAYETFHYPTGRRGARPPRVLYGPEERRLWEVLQPRLKQVPFEAPREEILANRADLETADKFWEHQIRSFAKLLSGEVQVHGPERLIEPFSHQFLKPPRDLLDRAMALSEAAGRVYEVSLPYANAAFGNAQQGGQYSNLRHLMSEIELALGREVHLHFTQNGRIQMRIPNFALWEGLLRARFGEAAHRPIFVDGIISRDDTMRLRGKLLAPVGLVRQATSIAEFQGKVDPFFVPFHDLFHQTMASMLPPDLCRSCGALYFPLQRALPASRVKQEHLNRLADLDPGSDFNGSPEIFVKFTLLPFWKTFLAQVESGELTHHRLQQFPRFLQSYRRVLSDESRNPGIDPVWREQFERRLAEFGDEFSRLLVSVLRK